MLSAIPHYHPPLESSLFTIGGHRETRFDVAKWVVMDASRELVVAGTTDGAVLTYDRTTGAALDVCANLSQHTPEGNKHVICIRLDGPHIFATGNDRSAVIFLDGRPTLNVERSTNYDMRGNILVTTPRLDYRNEGSLYNLKTGEHIFLPRQPFSIKLVSVGEHAVALVTEGLEKGERQLRLLNHNAELTHVIDAHDDTIWDLASDDMYILSGSADGTARLWDQKTGQRMQTLQHGECVRAVALRGNLAATGSNYSVKLWDRSNGALRQTLHRSERLTSLTLGDDGVIVTGPSTLETWRHSKRPAAT